MNLDQTLLPEGTIETKKKVQKGLTQALASPAGGFIITEAPGKPCILKGLIWAF